MLRTPSKSAMWRAPSIRVWFARYTLTMRRPVRNSRGFARAETARSGPAGGAGATITTACLAPDGGAAMHNDEENEVRRKIRDLLGNGLRTQTEPFPETEKEFTQLLAE